MAKEVVDILKQLIPPHQREQLIEPSAGNGSFLGHFDNVLAFDLFPQHDDIIQQNFLKLNPKNFPDKSTTTILGNPPFGHARSLAIKFFNHASLFADTIAFIVPATFRKFSTLKQLNLNFHLVHDSPLPKNSFVFEGKPCDIPCIFQIWQYKNEPRIISIPENTIFNFIKKADATEDTFCISRVGNNAGEVLLGLDHPESSTYFCDAKIPFAKQIIRMMAIYGGLEGVVDSTAAQKSLSKPEIPLVVKYTLENHRNLRHKYDEYFAKQKN